jgi:carbonic anhydrase/acetyltransferase-like protein (isoleucine patch superfamily)
MIYSVFQFLAKKFKGESLVIDSRFSSSYLVYKMFQFILKRIRGWIFFPTKHDKGLLLGKRVSLISKNLFVLNGKGYHFDDGAYVDATSIDGIRMGNNISIQKRVIIECTGSLSKLGVGLVLGDNVGIGSNSFLGCAGGISIGNDTILGNFVSMHSENHNYADKTTPIRLQGVQSKGIKIGSNCWIGAKATILDGVRLGDGCIVAAGAVVIEGTYPENSILGGIPAKIIKSR